MIFTCIVSGFIWSVVGLALFRIGNPVLDNPNVKEMYRVSALSKDPNFFAAILIGWIQLAFFWVIKKDGRDRVFCAVALLTMLLAFILTYSRGAYVAFFILSCMNIFFFFRFRQKLRTTVEFKRITLISGSFVALVVVAVMVFSNIVDRVMSINPDDKLGSGRGYIWMDAVKVIKKNPLGVGLNNYSVYTAKNWKEYTKPGSQVHNVFLHITAETGIFGFIAYMVFLGTVFFKIRFARYMQDPDLMHWYIGAFISIIGILGCSLFISNIYRENVFVAIALFLAVFKLYRQPPETRT